MAELRLDFADKDRTVIAKVGDTIVITLAENATTGFQWKIVSLTENTLTLESTDGTESPWGAPGAGGSEAIFRLKAKATGPGKVIMKLTRGTEREDSTFEFGLNLNVQSSSAIDQPSPEARPL